MESATIRTPPSSGLSGIHSFPSGPYIPEGPAYEKILHNAEFVSKWSLSYLKPIFVAIFVTIAMAKVKFIPDFYFWTIVLIN